MNREGVSVGPDDFVGRTLRAPKERCSRFTRLILKYADSQRPLEVLDLGCGTGEQVFDLAEAMPTARFTGVDISAANIRAAEDVRERHACRERMTFVATDYMELRTTPFDLILSWGVLHLIPAPTGALFSKIASDLNRGGLLVSATPYRCLHNSALGLVRRVLRAIRSHATDRAILALSQYLYGAQYPEPFLRERVFYMYCPANRYDSPNLHEFLRTMCGLELVGIHPEPRISRLQFKHRISVFRKR